MFNVNYKGQISKAPEGNSVLSFVIKPLNLTLGIWILNLQRLAFTPCFSYNSFVKY